MNNNSEHWNRGCDVSCGKLTIGLESAWNEALRTCDCDPCYSGTFKDSG